MTSDTGTQGEGSGSAALLRRTPDALEAAREFVRAYVPERLTHQPTGIGMMGYTVLREGDTHVRFVHSESDEARLVGHLRAVLALLAG